MAPRAPLLNSDIRRFEQAAESRNSTSCAAVVQVTTMSHEVGIKTLSAVDLRSM
jgi:hypothetical protein